MSKTAQSTREPESKLVMGLRRLGPHTVRVMNGDDEREVIAVPTRRRKWSAVVEAIEARAWTSCIARDKAGNTLGHIENESAATEVVDLAAMMPAGANGQLLLAERIVNVAMQASERTLRHRDAEVTALLQAQNQVVVQMANAVQSLSDVWKEQREAAADAAHSRMEAMQAEAEATAAAAGGDWQQLMAALPALLQLLPALKSLAAGGAVSNGVNPH